jgi:hypothetical protein
LTGGIGYVVFGGAPAIGGFVVPAGGRSLLLQAASDATPQSRNAIMHRYTVLDIFLQIVSGGRFVLFAGKWFARHSIFTLDPAAEVH